MTSVTVLPAEEEPAATLDPDPHGDADAEGSADLNTAADWLPGIRDEHEDSDGARRGATGRRGTGR